MKQEAHLYCTLKLATDKDLVEQVGAATGQEDQGFRSAGQQGQGFRA